jgi:hypothetical protein
MAATISAPRAFQSVPVVCLARGARLLQQTTGTLSLVLARPIPSPPRTASPNSNLSDFTVIPLPLLPHSVWLIVEKKL